MEIDESMLSLKQQTYEKSTIKLTFL